MTKAQQTYLSVLKQQEEIKRKKEIYEEEMKTQSTLAKMDFNSVDLQSMNIPQLKRIAEGFYGELSRLKKEEEGKLRQIETYENLKQNANIDDINNIKRFTNDLKAEFQQMTTKFNKMKSKIGNQKKELSKKVSKPEEHIQY